MIALPLVKHLTFLLHFIFLLLIYAFLTNLRFVWNGEH